MVTSPPRNTSIKSTSRVKQPSPLIVKTFDVMRRTRASIDNPSEHMLNEYWNADRAVNSQKNNNTRPNVAGYALRLKHMCKRSTHESA